MAKNEMGSLSRRSRGGLSVSSAVHPSAHNRDMNGYDGQPPFLPSYGDSQGHTTTARQRGDESTTRYVCPPAGLPTVKLPLQFAISD